MTFLSLRHSRTSITCLGREASRKTCLEIGLGARSRNLPLNSCLETVDCYLIGREFCEEFLTIRLVN